MTTLVSITQRALPPAGMFNHWALKILWGMVAKNWVRLRQGAERSSTESASACPVIVAKKGEHDREIGILQSRTSKRPGLGVRLQVL
jgi:hypothetical protein